MIFLRHTKYLIAFLAICTIFATFKTAFAYDGDNVEPWERSAETHRNNLENSIEYIENMDLSGYTDASVSALRSAIETAKSVAAVSGSSRETYWGARNRLEIVRASLVPKSTVANGSEAAVKSYVPFRELSKEDVIEEMGTGINLGNTMDGHSSMTPGELVWQGVPTTKEIIRSMHDSGYNTIRVPVTWGNMINYDEETGEYSINEMWLNRVQEIVDYCVSQDIYAIVNIHHDGVNWNNGWFNIGHNDIDQVMEKYAAVWTIIAKRFKNYDEHLIFESMNEMTCCVAEHNMWNGSCMNYDRDILKSFNQLFVNTVRGTGGNNTKRWLASAGHFASSGKIDMPVDPCNQGTSHQMFAAHIYNSMDNILSELQQMPKNFDCAMYLGEWSTYLGTDGRTDTGYNDIAVAYDSQRVNRQCKISGICPIVWNCGMYTNDDGSVQTGGSQYWNRKDMKPVFDNIIDGVMRGSYLDPYSPGLESQYDSSITHTRNTNITSINCTDSIELTIGDVDYIDTSVSPTGTNDVLIWRSDDDNIATVSNGRVAAKRAGETDIYVYAQNSVNFGYYRHYTDDPYEDAVIRKIHVKVEKDTSKNVTFKKLPETVNAIVNEGTDIVYELAGAETDHVNFYSDDENIAIVNDYGHISGRSLGETTIHAVTSSGDEKTIRVSVIEKPRNRYMNLALFVYYNDSQHNFYSTEIGTPVKIEGDGTYTVTFDVDNDMSVSGIENGITTLNRVGSIYVNDYDVNRGNILDSNITSASIRWESLSINGTEFEIKDEYKDTFDPLKDGIFNTGNPINTWSGSIINEVRLEKEHEAVFTINDPKVMEVTFELSDIEWKAPESTPEPTAPPAQDPGNNGNGTGTDCQVIGVQTQNGNGTQIGDKTDASASGNTVGKISKLKIKKSKDKLTLSWKKISGAKYQIVYGTSKKNVKKFSGKKIKGVTVKSIKKNKFVIKKKNAKTKMYIKIRAFKKTDGKTVYGKWALKSS